ncbi:MAG: hypothetical protein A3G75_13955 [Verrucomicrobia bacterium RIFCSPLOWO2_12_FULL_64_8]|nr:MAG: hypothetical protein A3G75_13955 [Verrucomicrobia bacterium RIFCSPLOWO2_12_FULL_64_8]
MIARNQGRVGRHLEYRKSILHCEIRLGFQRFASQRRNHGSKVLARRISQSLGRLINIVL